METGINYYAGRIATFLGVVVGVIAALIPVLTDTDWTETTGILAGAVAAITVIRQFIIGAQKHEATIADPGNPINE